jgi:NarL family two-component system response regulator LiaR
MTTPIRVLVTDDHAIVRKGLRALLATEPRIEVVGEAHDGEQAITEAQRLRPDVILMDLVMPGIDGIEATRRIKACQPDVRVLVLSSYAADEQISCAIRAGASGYLLKDSSPGELVRAIQRVYEGESWLAPAVARQVLDKVRGTSGSEREPAVLTAREVEVLRLVARGQNNRRIAEQLEISEATVRGHVSNILAKLNLSNRTQAALYALREGLVSLHNSDPLTVL